MPLVTEAELRAQTRSRATYSFKASAQILKEYRDSTIAEFDVFLSHSFQDAELIEGAARELEKQGLRVYIDWQTDPVLDRTRVTVATAAHLRRRMRQCKMLVYAHTLNSSLSKWCPWELGYFDGFRGGNVFILPVASGTEYAFQGQEYLGLYPYLTSTDGKKLLIREAQTTGYVEAAKAGIFVRS